MMHLEKMTKKTNFRPNFGPPICFFVSFISTNSYALFQTIILCNLKENQLSKLQKMAKNLISGLILSRLAQIWAPKFFSVGLTSTELLDIVSSYHRIQFQGKLMIQTQENGE